MEYKINLNGEEIIYGSHVKRSNFSDEEWNLIHKEMIERNYGNRFADKMQDEDFVYFAGECIDLSERYEALLELLPQSSYSKAGTHPEWVANAVENNILIKEITQDDIGNLIKDSKTLGELTTGLIDYFEI